MATVDLTMDTFESTVSRDGITLVDFWASWCGPCKAEMPNMKKFYEKHRKDGFEIIGISLDSAKVELTNFLTKEPLPWPSIFEGGNDLADEYGVFSIPLAILVGRDGRVVSLDARGAELGRLLEDELGKK